MWGSYLLWEYWALMDGVAQPLWWNDKNLTTPDVSCGKGVGFLGVGDGNPIF